MRDDNDFEPVAARTAADVPGAAGLDGRPRPPEARRAQLDSLRLIAILGVLFDHGGIAARFVPGLVGVRFFLLLSGFLITRTLVQHAAAPWRESVAALRTFYARRALRIWPLYYAVILGLLAVGAIELREALIHGLFLTNLAQAVQNQWQVPSWFLPHLWTICVQEQFYIVWPLLFVALGAARRVAALWVMFALAIVFRVGMWAAGLHTQVGFSTLPFASFDALALGSLLAIGQARARAWLDRRTLRRACALAVGLSLAGLIGGLVEAVLLPTLWLIPLSVLILAAFEGRLGPAGRVLDWPPLVFLGRISLGIYLLHLPVAFAIVEWGPPWLLALVAHRTWSAFAINTSATLVLAVASWFLFERPLQRLGARKAYRPAPPSTALAPAE